MMKKTMTMMTTDDEEIQRGEVNNCLNRKEKRKQ